MKGFVSVEVLLIGAVTLGLFYAFLEPTVSFLSGTQEELATLVSLRYIVTELKSAAERAVYEGNVNQTIVSPVDANIVLGGFITAESAGHKVSIRNYVPIAASTIEIKRGHNLLTAYHDGNKVILEVTG